MFGECQGCVNNRAMFSARAVKFVGGFAAQLCVRCENEWHVFARATPEFARIREIAQRREEIDTLAWAALRSEERATRLAAEQRTLSSERDTIDAAFFAIGEKWVAGRDANRSLLAAKILSDDA